MAGYDLITFGEAMVRLTSPNHQRLEQASVLEVAPGGAEWNVAVNAARLGLRSAWVSRLVDIWSGRLIANKAREQGVDVSNIVWEPFDGVGRVRNGFYALEVGAGPRAAAVTYDRGHTAVSQMTPEMADWQKILDGARWLHVSGITPALSETLAETVVHVFRVAAEKGVRTSYDLNYRGKLWSVERAREVNARIVPHVKVLIGNEEDFEKCLGIAAEGTDQTYSKLDPESYKQVVREATGRFENIEMVGTTLRQVKSALLNDWRTLLFDGEQFHLSNVYEDLEIVDRVGGGDSFAAGLACSLLDGKKPAEANEFAAAYSALAHTFPGDMNWATRAEAEKVAGGAGARISR
ncbi:MAG: PfkB family carbohydrate kinase [Phycisphaerae bacterium]